MSTSDRLNLEERKGGGEVLTLPNLRYKDFGLYTCRWGKNFEVFGTLVTFETCETSDIQKDRRINLEYVWLQYDYI